MNRKAFILLAAPSMVGKTSAANHIGENYPDIKIVRNDDLLNELFDLAMFPRQEDVSKDEVWLPQISAKVDFMGLTRLLHKNIILENSDNSGFLAEGYMYMLAPYSDQVRLCMQNLDFKIEFFLLKYEPTIEVQIQRQKKRFSELGWHETDSEHEKQLKVKWKKFTEAQDSSFQSRNVNDININEAISEILEKCR